MTNDWAPDCRGRIERTLRRHCTADDLTAFYGSEGLGFASHEQTPDHNVLPDADVLSSTVSVFVSVASVRRRLRSSDDPCLGWSGPMVTSGEHVFADLESVLSSVAPIPEWTIL